jgi:L,D-transpeptidase YnhG
MASRRYFQRGHASVSASFPAVGSGGFPRWILAAGGLTATAAAVWLLSSHLGENRHSDAAPATGPSVSVEAAPPAPSLLNSALAKIQRNPTRDSGLMSVTLTEDSLKQTEPLLGKAEARLVGIYELIRQARHREALQQAEALTRDHPNFQLAQLVLGDLLTLQTRPIRTLGDVPDTKAMAAEQQLNVLREQSRRRLLALTERPPEGAVPTQFLSLSNQSRHAIAVDASRSRLYLFENVSTAPDNGKGLAPARLKLVGDYYISVGQSGIDKLLEGDLRTPVGVYYITSSLDPNKLPDLYGSGALPINYPNARDVQRGKTGSGIWLHGSPSEQFARPPQASEGCVVLSNPDFESILARVETRTTPVVIANELNWVAPDALEQDRVRFQASLEAWRQSKSQGNLEQLRTHYSSQFNNQGQNLNDWWPRVASEVKALGAKEVQLKDLSMLNWRDKDDTMVVTFGEVAQGQTRGQTKRQYWIREEDQWKIFYEGPV